MSVAVLGCGAWGKNLVRNFHHLARLAAVVDPDPHARQRSRELAPLVAVHHDLARVLDDPRVHAVAIATPAESHLSLCLAAIQAGKDVLCEKPLALACADAQRIDALATARSRIVMVGHILEYHPAIVALRALIEAGALGAIRYLHATRLHPQQTARGALREKNVLWSLAPHDVAVILRLVGQMPTRVVATGGAHDEAGALDVSATQLHFERDVVAHLFVSNVHPYKEQRLVVVGSERTAVFDDVRRELVLHRSVASLPSDVAASVVSGRGERIAYRADEPLRLECEAFLSAMRTRAAPLTDARSAMDVLEVLEAAEASLEARGAPTALRARA